MSRHSICRPLRVVRFLAGLLICSVIFTFAPTVAQASFAGRATAPVTVSTYDIPAPAGVTGTYSCNSARTSVTVTITDFGAVARATGYTVTLTAPSGAVSSNPLPASTRATTITRASTRTGTFTLRIRATVGSWLGDEQTTPITC